MKVGIVRMVAADGLKTRLNESGVLQVEKETFPHDRGSLRKGRHAPLRSRLFQKEESAGGKDQRRIAFGVTGPDCFVEDSSQ